MKRITLYVVFLIMVGTTSLMAKPGNPTNDAGSEVAITLAFGETVGTFSATQDPGASALVWSEVSGVAGSHPTPGIDLFEINPTTGVVTISDETAFQALSIGDLITYKVKATDDTGPSSPRAMKLEVVAGGPVALTITDLETDLDFADLASGAGSVSASGGTGTGYVYSEKAGGDGENTFDIDASTGAITVEDEMAITADTTMSFDITVADDGGDPAIDLTVLITVSPDPSLNVPPVISGDPATEVVEEDDYLFEPEASDANDDELTFIINVTLPVTLPAWLSFDTDSGALSGTPLNADIGSITGIVITVNDGTTTTDLPSFDIEVTEFVNTAPTISGTPSDTVEEGQPYIFEPESSDVDGDDLTFTLQGDAPEWLSIDPDTGDLSGTPTHEDIDTYTGLSIVVSDTEDEDTLGPFSIEVTAIPNNAPTITATPPATVMADTAYSYTPTSADADEDELSFTLTGEPAWLSINASTGEIHGDPEGEDVGTTSGIYITVFDGEDYTDSATFSIEVTPFVNTAPTISGTPATVAMLGQEYTFTPTAFDANGHDLEFEVLNLPEWADFDEEDGTISGTPNGLDLGSYDEIRITVTDNYPGTAATNLADFDIEVVAPPTIADLTINNTYGSTVVDRVIAGDINFGTNFTYTEKVGGTNAAIFNIISEYSVIDGQDVGRIVVADLAAIEQDETMDYEITVTTSEGGTADFTVEITISEQLPEFTSVGSVEILDVQEEDETFFTLEAFSNNDVEFFENTMAPHSNLFDVDEETGEVSLTENATILWGHTYPYTVIAIDDDGDEKSVVLNINVVRQPLDLEVPNYIGALGASIYDDHTTAIILDVHAVSDSAIMFTESATGDNQGLFDIALYTGEITLTSTITPGTYSYNIVAEDEEGESTPAVVTVFVEAAPTSPVFTAASYTYTIHELAENQELATNLSVSGGEAPYTYTRDNADTIFEVSATGAINLVDDSQLDYETMDPSHEYTFVVTVEDADGKTEDQTITVVITNINEVSIPAGQTWSGISEAQTSGSIGVKLNVDDEDGSDLSYTFMPNSALFTIDDEGDISVAGTLDFENSPYVLTVRVTDGTSNQYAEETIEINVIEFTPLDLITAQTFGPVVEGLNSSVNTFQVDVLGGATGVTYTIDSGDVNIDANGLVTLNGDLDYENSPGLTFVVTASKAGQPDDTETMVIYITDIDDTGTVSFNPGASTTRYIDENSALGTIISPAVNADVTFSNNVKYTTSSPYYTIDEDTGYLRVDEENLLLNLDFENGAHNTHNLTVTATDEISGASDTLDITIYLNDLIEDGRPIVLEDQIFNLINPGFVTGDVTGIVVAATGDNLTYWVGTNDAFNIDPATGTLLVSDPTEFFVGNSLVVTVYAMNQTSSEVAFADVTVNVTEELVGADRSKKSGNILKKVNRAGGCLVADLNPAFFGLLMGLLAIVLLIPFSKALKA